MMQSAGKLAFLGLGVMGYPMAGHLARAGHSVTVYNRTRAKADAWLEEYGDGSGALAVAATPAEAAGADIIFMCLGADKDVEAVCTGPAGLIEHVRPGSLIVDHTTISAECTERLAARFAEVGVSFMDAPVSGGQAGAEGGKLTVMCGGTEEDFARAEPVMAAYSARMRLLGQVGAGQRAKMVNQICIAGVLQGLSEALYFAENVGLDPVAVVDVIRGGAAQSWQMENRAHTMAEDKFDFGFAVDWMRKDLGIVLAEARQKGMSLPLTALVDQFYGDVQRMGGGRDDTSSLIRRLRAFDGGNREE